MKYFRISRICLVSFVISCLIKTAQGQERAAVFYFSSELVESTSKKKYLFKREIELADTGRYRYRFIETYATGSLKRSGTAKTYTPNLVLDGLIKEYHSNGRLKSSVWYASNKRRGEARFYFKNGVLND